MARLTWFLDRDPGGNKICLREKALSGIDLHHPPNFGTAGFGPRAVAPLPHVGRSVGQGPNRARLDARLTWFVDRDAGGNKICLREKSGGHRDLLIAFSARQAESASIDCLLRGPLWWFADWIFVATRAVGHHPAKTTLPNGRSSVRWRKASPASPRRCTTMFTTSRPRHVGSGLWFVA